MPDGEMLAKWVAVLGALLPAALWFAFWLWAVNWQNLWPVLARGAWAPLVLLMLVTAQVWSSLDPTPCTCLVLVTVPTFWWQLGGVSALVALALLAGWLQGYLGWAPPEINLEPPTHTHHGHGHGHH